MYFVYLDQDVKEVIPCYKTCPVECETVKHAVRISEAQLGHKLVYKRLQQRVPGWENKSFEEISSYIR